MRRSDREITDFQELITVMRGCDVCRLALHDEPYPYILPLNFGLEVDGETVRLYFHGANTGTKYDLIAKNPNVAFEMDRGHALILDDEHGNCTMTYESVIGQGRISVVPDADKERALRVLMAQYRAPDFPYSKAVIPATTVLCLTVEHMTGKRRVKNTAECTAHNEQKSPRRQCLRGLFCDPAADQRMKLVNLRASVSGRGTPAASPAAMHCSSQSKLRASWRMVCRPSSSCATSSGRAPCTIGQY